MKKLLFIIILFYIGFVAGCSKDKSNFADEGLTTCDLQTEQILPGLKNFETKVFSEYPENRYEMPSFIIYKNDTATLIRGFTYYKICNLSQVAKHWRIPLSGLTVLLSGKIYKSSENHGIQPAIYAFYDLELTSLKRKQQ